MQQFAGARHGFAREFCRQRFGQSRRNARAREFFGEQEDIGRAGAGHGGDRIHQRFVINPLDAASGAQQRARDIALPGRDSIGCDGDRNSAPDGGRRIRHGADHLAATDLGDACDSGAGHDRDDQRGWSHQRLELRSGVAKHLRFHCDDQNVRMNVLGVRIDPHALRREAARFIGRIGLDHDGALRVEALRKPTGQHRAAHLARAREHQGAGETFQCIGGSGH